MRAIRLKWKTCAWSGVFMAALSAAAARADDWTPLWTTANLSQGRGELAATAAGGKIFFGGGIANNTASNVVDIYDTASGVWTTATLSQPRFKLAAAAAGGKVFFAGGHD